MGSLYQSMVTVIEQAITPLAGKLGQQKYVIAIRDGFTAALPFMIIGSFMLVFIFPPFSADTTNSFARAWLDFSVTYRQQLMLPFHLSMGVMTFFISVGIGASLGRQFNLDPIMSGLLAFMAFLLVAAPMLMKRSLRSTCPVREFLRPWLPRFMPPVFMPGSNSITSRFACPKKSPLASPVLLRF